MRRIFINGLSLSLILTLFSCNKDAAEKPEEVFYNNPVSPLSLADPTVIRGEDGAFYVYATGRNGEIAKSLDLLNWEWVGSIFEEAYRPTFLDGGDIWAPDINRINGQYVIYYSLSKWGEEFKNGIGVAVSNKPEGPFTDLGKLMVSDEIGVQNSIDPCYVEDNGRKYLFWGSFRGLYAIELSDDGLQLKSGAEKTLVAGTAYEGVYIHKRNGYYYMFASILTCCEGARSLYTTVVGRSESLLGPYVNKKGQRMLNNFHEMVIAGNAKFAGTGHNSEIVEDDAGQSWIMYHAYEKSDDRWRKLMLDKVEWVNDWPTVKNSTASIQSMAPFWKR